MLPGFFGGEGGITTNRTAAAAVLGITFGPQIQVYYLIAVWCFVCMIAMYAFTRTPLGRMCNAVRDNPERVEFVGYNPQTVRFIAFCSAGFFAGIAGGAGGDQLRDRQRRACRRAASGVVLLVTFIGGVGFFFGPIIGAVLVTFLRSCCPSSPGLAALLRPDLPRHRDVRAGRHRQPADDAPAAVARAACCSRLLPAYLVGARAARS